LLGKIKIGCAVGYGGVVTADDGDPTYVEIGYVEGGYQFFTGTRIVIPTDVGYTVPVDQPDDDGLVFPLDYRQVVVRNEIVTTGEVEVTKTAMKEGDYIVGWDYSFGPSTTQYELELRPVTNGPFNNQYAIDVTALQIPKMIDLEAVSA
jgi:hypothetical protein